jgi:hypothetical protein
MMNVSWTTLAGYARLLILVVVLLGWLLGKVNAAEAALTATTFLGILGSFGLIKAQDSQDPKPPAS